MQDYKTRAFVNSDYVKQGQMVVFQVRGENFFVMKVTDTEIVLFGECGVITHKKGVGIYYTIVKGDVEPIKMMNVKSNISHWIKNGKSLCGTVGAFSEMTSADTVTCGHCLKNME